MFKERVLFDVTDAECEEMIQSLSQEDDAWTEEVKHLSRSWIKAIMAQPYTKNKSIRRPFHYSKKKLSSYLAWRKECNLTEEMSYYMKCEDKFHFNSLHAHSNDLYWYGTDNNGSPNLWYRADKTKFHLMNAKNGGKAAALIMQAALDRMPRSIHDINFIICFDQYDTLSAMKNPSLGPTFIKKFMKICPDRLKSAYFITGALGAVFYNLAKRLAPSSIMDKVVCCKSREEAGLLLLKDDVLKEHELPTFLGGGVEQNVDIIENYSTMINKIEQEMNKKAGM